MSKKNNRGKDQRYNKFLIEREARNAALAAKEFKRKQLKNAKIMQSMDDTLTATRKANSRKPKVAPVMGSKVKLDKMLKKQMGALSLSG